MMPFTKRSFWGFLSMILICAALGGFAYNATAADLNSFVCKNDFAPAENMVITEEQFNGYTNHWHNDFWKWIQYGNLFQIGAPNVDYTIAQSKIDIADELGNAGFYMQEGFLNALLKEPYRALEAPSLQILEESLGGGNVLVYVDPATAVGRKLAEKMPSMDAWKKKLKSYQMNLGSYHEAGAFCLESGETKLFVVSADCPKCKSRIKELIGNVESVLSQYDLHRGWFGAATLENSVTISKGHPLEVIGWGMNQGNSWFTFAGYMEFINQNLYGEWLSKVNLPITLDFGSGRHVGSIGTWGFGLDNYDGLQVQDIPSEQKWIEYIKERNGYVFRAVYNPSADPYHYDGYIANTGNKKQIDNENIPFILMSGMVSERPSECMVLFVDKNAPLNKKRMWDAILSRKAVGVSSGGVMMGDALYRNVLQMLLLDRVYLDEYWNDRIKVDARVDVRNRKLVVTLNNTYPRSVSGNLEVTPAPEVLVKGGKTMQVILPARTSKVYTFDIQATLSAMDKANPIAVHYSWDNHKKSTLTLMDMPPAISVHRVLYGHAPGVQYPVTVHNFSDQSDFPVKVQVFETGRPSNVVYEATQNASATPGSYEELTFVLQIPAGNYNVKASAIGAETVSQLGVGRQGGKPYIYTIDIDGDGHNEYRMENDKVRVTIIPAGARVIEYIIKERDDNVFFKYWPEKVYNDRDAGRETRYYPYGGFEDFLGQASMETHWIFDGEITKSEGDYVQVKMTADFYGNKMTKIFTLYGDSPLLEARFALQFINSDANMLGPQPIFALGDGHWTDDLFTIKSAKGLEQFRMRPESLWGRALFPIEGWNAGYDEKKDVSIAGAFPVDQPIFLHMWMNTPLNSDTPFYYVEFQPWVPIVNYSTMYFSYYFWGQGGAWQESVKALEERNLVTKR